MKKTSLLLLLAIVCYISGFANDRYYLIKDGRLQNGATIEPSEISQEFAEGDGYATVKHTILFSTAKLTGMQGLHVGTKNLIIEYAVDPINLYGEEESVNRFDPAIMINCVSDENSKFNLDAYKIINPDDASQPTTVEPYMISINYIDAKGEGCDKEWNKYEGFTYARNNEEVKAVFVSYMHEYEHYPTDGVLKIKNLYFETNTEEHPIYGCQFDSYDTWTEKMSMNSYISRVQRRIDPSDSTGKTYVKDENGKINYDTLDMRKQYFQDGLALTCDSCQIYYETCYVYDEKVLEYEKKYPVSELRSSLSVMEDSKTLYFKDIPLSEDVIKAGKIKVSCIAKINPRLFNGEPEKEKANIKPIPIYLKFDNSEDAVAAFIDTAFQYVWSKTSGEFEIPAGAKSVTVEFRSRPNLNYLVDYFLISYNGSANNALMTINSDGKTISIYPNPVDNEILFNSNEKIESVEIVSLNGKVMTCKAENNRVNVSSLASGEYIIIVNKNITSKFVKK